MTLKVLTVGDGDLSFSLALKRAFPEIQTLVATTLVESQEKLLNTYPHAAAILQELTISPHERTSQNVTLLYGVDATQLHHHFKLLSIQQASPFDLILFQHPHLGYDTVKDESSKERHCQRHASLLAHYFFASKQLLSLHHHSSKAAKVASSCIHVCVSGSAADRWKLHDAVQRLHLEYAWGSPFPASRPILPPESDRTRLDEARCNVDSKQPHPSIKSTKRGKRRGHWLGKYGYRHQPTFPESTTFQTNVSDSLHYFLKSSSLETPLSKLFSSRDHPLRCNVCLQNFSNVDALHAHQLVPAFPVEDVPL